MQSFTFELFFSNINANTTWNDAINGKVKTTSRRFRVNNCKTREEAEAKLLKAYPDAQVVISEN